MKKELAENINSYPCLLHVQGLLFLWPNFHPCQHGLDDKPVEGSDAGVLGGGVKE